MSRAIVFLAFLISISPVSFAQGQHPRNAESVRQELFDFRSPLPENLPSLTDSEKQEILSAVFHSYLAPDESFQGHLPPLQDRLAAARQAGCIYPRIVSVAHGSFTSAGISEIAYIIDVAECTAAHADDDGTKRLVIFNGKRLVANFDAKFHSRILQIFDLDRDGINELLLGYEHSGQGSSERSAMLVSMNPGRLKVIKDFGWVKNSSCDVSNKPGDITAAVIFFRSAVRAKGLQFRIDYYRAKCMSNEKIISEFRRLRRYRMSEP